MSSGRTSVATAQAILVHVCTRPDEPVPDAWVETLVVSEQAGWLLRAAERTMVAGLLWFALTPAQRKLLPDECAGRLQALHLGNALRWQTYRKLLISSATRLAEAGIPVAVLKGSALLLAVYPDPGQRTMVDLDLLVPDEHLTKAHELLGREAAQVSHALTPHRHLGEIRMEGEGGMIELHGVAAHEASWPRTGDLFANGRRATLEGARVSLPSDSDLWLHLACHGFTHGPSYWPRMAADLARLYSLPHWDEQHWRAVWQAAQHRGAGRVVLLAAALAGGGRVPAGLREAGVPNTVCELAAAQAREAWGIATTARARNFGPWARSWVSGGTRRREHIMAHLFRPRTVLMGRLHVPLVIGTVLYPGYLLWKALRLVWTGLAWRAALRTRSFPELLDRP